MYHTEPPMDKTIHEWYMKFQQSGCLCTAKWTGWPGLWPRLLSVREKHLSGALRSQHIARAGNCRCLSQVFGVFCTNVFAWEDTGCSCCRCWMPRITIFVFTSVWISNRLEEDRFAEKLVFSDNATFHMCGKVNRHNVRIWGTENLHAMMEHVRDSPKVNVFCAVSSCKVYGPFFFAEPFGKRKIFMQRWNTSVIHLK